MEKVFINGIREAYVALYLVEMLHRAVLSASKKRMIIKCANVFPSSLLLSYFYSIYGLRKCLWTYHTAHKAFEEDQMSGTGFVRQSELECWTVTGFESSRSPSTVFE